MRPLFHDRHRASRDYWAKRHTDPAIAQQHDERFGDAAEQLDDLNLKTIARLAAMTPEQREANSEQALRDLGEHLCPKHYHGQRREKWIELRTASIYAAREAKKEAAELHGAAAGKPILEDEAAWSRDVGHSARAADSLAALAAIRSQILRTCRQQQASYPAIWGALTAVIDATRRLGQQAIEHMPPDQPPILPTVAPPVIVKPIVEDFVWDGKQLRRIEPKAKEAPQVTAPVAAPIAVPIAKEFAPAPLTESGYLFPAAILAAAKASSVQHMLF